MSKYKENNYVNRKDINISQKEVYELNFERFVDFMTLMIEKYGKDIVLPDDNQK